MDPIFEYARDPRLYWKTHFIAKDQAGAQTCGNTRCTRETATDIYVALRDDFRASYIILDNLRQPNMIAYLDTDRRFEKVFSTGRQTIYKLETTTL